MIPLGVATRVYLAAGATDLRQSFEGLSGLARHRLKELEGSLEGSINSIAPVKADLQLAS
jgi:hypothetical protein